MGKNSITCCRKTPIQRVVKPKSDVKQEHFSDNDNENRGLQNRMYGDDIIIVVVCVVRLIVLVLVTTIIRVVEIACSISSGFTAAPAINREVDL